METSAYQRQLVVIECGVSLVQHVLLSHSLFPSCKGALQNIELALIPCPVVSLVSLSALVKDLSKDESCAYLRLPSTLEKLQKSLPAFKLLAIGKAVTVLVEAGQSLGQKRSHIVLNR